MGQLTGLRATVSNAGTAFLNRAVGVEVALTTATAGSVSQAVAFSVAVPTNAGTIASLYGLQIPDLTAGTANNYAIYTGLGPVRLGDSLSVAGMATVGGFKLATGAVAGRILTSDANGVGTWQPPGADPTNYPCNGRLTLSSGVPVTTADVTAATTLYFTPYQGNRLELYTGSAWASYTLAETSLALGSLAANTDYDIFIYDNTGTLTLEAVAWTAPTSAAVTNISNASPRVVSTGTTPTTGQLVTITGNSVGANNATWRVGTVTAGVSFQLLNLDGTNSSAPGSVGTGGTWQRADQNVARVTNLATQDGIYVKSGAAARRYVGTIRITHTAGQCEDSHLRRFIYSYDNRVARKLVRADSTASWGTANNVWHADHNDFNNRVEFVVGISEDVVSIRKHISVQPPNTTLPSAGLSGVSLDAVAAPTYFNRVAQPGNGPAITGAIDAGYSDYPGAGYHYAQGMENVTNVNVGTTFFGNGEHLIEGEVQG